MIVRLTKEETLKKFKSRPDDQIFIFDNMISDEHCDYLRKYIDTHAVQDETKVINTTNVKAYVYELFNSTNGYLFNNILNPIFNNLMDILERRYLIHFSNFVDKVLLRKIYGDTRLHMDGASEKGRPKRQLAFILCLNNDYESGEIIFPSQNRKIKLKKGQILLFPPYWTHPHYTNAPENNTFRYTVTTWLCD